MSATFEQLYSAQVYSSDVDDRLLVADFPQIARAVKLVREKLDFRGGIEVRALGKHRAGEYSRGTGVIRINSNVEQRGWQYAVEIAVHEAIHALGVRHMDNFRSYGGSRCVHGRDTLTHCVTEIITGKETFANMKFLHQQIGAFSKKLLRQVAMVEAILRTQRGIPDALGGCEIADLTDLRMYRWQQMTPEQKRLQVNKMKVGRMKSLGWDFKVSACHNAPASYNGRTYTYRCDECYRECDVRDA